MTLLACVLVLCAMSCEKTIKADPEQTKIEIKDSTELAARGK